MFINNLLNLISKTSLSGIRCHLTVLAIELSLWIQIKGKYQFIYLPKTCITVFKECYI